MKSLYSDLVWLKCLSLQLGLMKEQMEALHMAPLMVPMMSHLRVHDLKTHFNYKTNIHWVILMKPNIAYLRAHHWDSEGEALGSEEGMVLGTGEVLCSTLGAAKNVKIGIDDGTELGSLVGSLEGSNIGIPKGAFLGNQIEEASCGA